MYRDLLHNKEVSGPESEHTSFNSQTIGLTTFSPSLPSPAPCVSPYCHPSSRITQGVAHTLKKTMVPIVDVQTPW